MNPISFLSANYIARQLGYHMTPLLLLVAVHAGAQTVPGEIPVKNSGFEEPYIQLSQPTDPTQRKAEITGSVAQDWSDFSDWANIAVDYSNDTENPHGGSSSQRVVISRVTEGHVLLAQRMDLEPNREYTFHVWLRSQDPGALVLTLRQLAEPYTYYGQTTCRVTPEWQEFTVSGRPDSSGTALLMILADKPLTYWVDDAKLSASD